MQSLNSLNNLNALGVSSVADRSFLKQFPLGADGMAFSSRNLTKPKTEVVRGLLTGTSIEIDSKDFLTSIVTKDIQALYNNAMWFGGSGSGDYVDLTDVVPDSDTDFSIEFDIYPDTQVQGNLLDTMKNSYQTLCTLIIYPGGNLGIFIRNDSGGTFFKTLQGILTERIFQRLKVEHVSSTKTLSFYVDGVFDNSITYTGTVSDLTPWRIGSRNSGSLNEIQGVVKNVTIETNGVVTSQIAGDGNTDANWEDTVGSNNGTVNGSPSLFTGQSFDGTSPVWYNQNIDKSILSLYGKRAYFDGLGNDYVDLGSQFDEIRTSGEFNISFKLLLSSVPTSNNIYYNVIGNRSANTGLFIYVASANNSATGKTAFRPHIHSSGSFRTFDSAFEPNPGIIYNISLVGDGTDMKLVVDGQEDANSVSYNSGAITAFASNMKVAGGDTEEDLDGTIWDITISDSADGSGVISSYKGYGNTDADWLDQTGSNNGTVNGSPAIFYGQKLSNFTQTTAGDQLDIVTDGATAKIGNLDALVSDGSELMTIDHNIVNDPTTYLMVSCVVTATTNGYFIAKYDTTSGRTWGLRVTSNNLVVAFGNPADGSFAGTYDSSSTFDFTSPIVVGFVFNAGTCTLYVNSVEESGGGVVPASLYASDVDISLMSRLNGGNLAEGLTGEIAEVIYTTDSSIDIVKLQKNQMKAANIT